MATPFLNLVLQGANAIGANFNRANLEGANLQNINASHAIFWQANLKSADLSGADLRDANLSGANLEAANLLKICWGKNVKGRDTNWKNVIGLVTAQNVPTAILIETQTP